MANKKGCVRFKKAKKHVCTDFAGGHGKHQKGKHCVATKVKMVRVCADFAKHR
jgi:hypothetical protein